MASGDTKTNQYLDIAANGTRADLPSDTCCETRTQTLIRGVAERVMDVEEEVERLENNPDVVDIVATYADLEDYDTSGLTDKDVIRVLQDETHNGDSTYYRWDATAQEWTYIGESKQYTDFVGTDGTTAGEAGLVPAPAITDAGKFLKADGTWDTAGSLVNVVQTTGASTADVMSQDATTKLVYSDTSSNYTHRVRIGTGAKTISTNYMSATAIGARSNANGNGAIAISAGGGSSTDTAVASADSVAIGVGSSIAIGATSVALGAHAQATSQSTGGVAIGAYSWAKEAGEMNIGTTSTTYGYNGSNYRLLTGLYDGQSDHDAATYGQVISYSAINGAGAPTTATEGKYVGQLYYDTTNEAMYFLKTIDTTTTPATYTWEALGGGSSVNVVQTTGTSTTDVMSQNAVTSMVFHDPAVKNQIAIGNETSISVSSSNKAIGIGERATIDEFASGGIAIGNAIAGIGPRVRATNGVAIGNAAVAVGQGSIALGTQSSASQTGEMNIGTSQTGYGYNSSNYRLLTGLYDPQNDHDAATKGYVDNLIATLEARIAALEGN